MKLGELVALLYEYEIVEIRMNKKKIFENKNQYIKYLDIILFIFMRCI